MGGESDGDDEATQVAVEPRNDAETGFRRDDVSSTDTDRIDGSNHVEVGNAPETTTSADTGTPAGESRSAAGESSDATQGPRAASAKKAPVRTGAARPASGNAASSGAQKPRAPRPKKPAQKADAAAPESDAAKAATKSTATPQKTTAPRTTKAAATPRTTAKTGATARAPRKPTATTPQPAGVVDDVEPDVTVAAPPRKTGTSTTGPARTRSTSGRAAAGTTVAVRKKTAAAEAPAETAEEVPAAAATQEGESEIAGAESTAAPQAPVEVEVAKDESPVSPPSAPVRRPPTRRRTTPTGRVQPLAPVVGNVTADAQAIVRDAPAGPSAVTENVDAKAPAPAPEPAPAPAPAPSPELTRESEPAPESATDTEPLAERVTAALQTVGSRVTRWWKSVAAKPRPTPTPTPTLVPTPMPTPTVQEPEKPTASLPTPVVTVAKPEPEHAPEHSGDVVLAIHGLVKRYGSTVAVDHVDLEIRAGTFFGIVGPNGAGKTTTLSIATGLIRPDSGTVTLLGTDLWKSGGGAVKKSLGVLPDRLRLFDRLTGAQFLYYSATLRGLDGATARKRSADLAAAFGLHDALDRLVSDYSVGMTKKVAIAAAIIHSPRVLVLDEPFESVDPVSAATVAAILQRYVAGGGTVLLSSHSMDLVERICDSVAVIVDGHVLASGTVDEVRQGQSLEERFIDLAGGRSVGEGLEWLHSFSA